MPSLRRSLRVGALLVVGAVLGCQAGPAPRDHFYRLDLAAPAPREKPILTGTVEVDRLRMEAVAEGRRIVFRYESGSSEVHRHAYHHWADAPSSMVQDQMVQYLRAAGLADTVVTPAVRVRPDYRLTGRIGSLEQVTDGGGPRVVVDLELALIREDDDAIVSIESYREERPAAGADVPSTVRAMEEALAAILARFVADVAAAAH